MTNCPLPPCVDPEMKNALAIERNTASITALTKSFQEISVQFSAVKTEVEDLKARLKEIIIEGFEEIFKERLEEEKEARIAGDVALQTQCDTLNTGKADKTDLEAEKIARADADLVLQARIQAFEGLAVKLVNEEADIRKSADDELDVRVTALEGGSGTVAEQIAAEKEARIAGDNILTESIATEKTDRIAAVNAVSASLSESVTSIQEKDASQDVEIGKKADKDDVDAKIAESSAAIATTNASLDALATRVTTAEGKITALEGMSADLETAKADILQAKADIATVSQSMTDVSNREVSHYETLSGRIDSLEKMILEYIQR